MVMFFLLLIAATRPSRVSLPPSSGTIRVPGQQTGHGPSITGFGMSATAWEIWSQGVLDTHRNASTPGGQHCRRVNDLGAES